MSIAVVAVVIVLLLLLLGGEADGEDTVESWREQGPSVSSIFIAVPTDNDIVVVVMSRNISTEHREKRVGASALCTFVAPGLSPSHFGSSGTLLRY